MTLPPHEYRPPRNEPSWQMRVLDDEDIIIGGAVHLSPRLLVTCAHVVNFALGRHEHAREHPGEGATVRLGHAGGRVWTARVGTEMWSSGQGSRDLAVLWITSPGFPDGRFPVLGSCARLSLKEPLHTTGYPQHYAIHSSLLYIGEGGPSEGSHQARTPPDEPVHITRGFSGCGVLTESGELVGLVQQNYYPEEPPDAPPGLVFLLPTDDLPTGGTESVQRLSDKALGGSLTYDHLHDLLDSVTEREVPSGPLLRDEERRRVWERHGDSPSAWRVLMALWDIIPPRDEPPLRLLWVHHVQQVIGRKRPLPPSIERWVRREASEHLGPEWREVLRAHREQRLLGDSPPHVGEPAPAVTVPPTVPDERPDTVVLFEVAPELGAYKLSHSLAHRAHDGYDLRPQNSVLVQRYQIRTRIGDLLGQAMLQRQIVPGKRPLRLSFVLPKHLLGLNLGGTTSHHRGQENPPSLASEYEVVYHVRERVRGSRVHGTAVEPWRMRTARQQRSPIFTKENLVFFWEGGDDDASLLLKNPAVTVCAVDSGRTDVHALYDAALRAGLPTIIRGPHEVLSPLIQELLEQGPQDGITIRSLPSSLQVRAETRKEVESIAVIHDEHDDMLFHRGLKDNYGKSSKPASPRNPGRLAQVAESTETPTAGTLRTGSPSHDPLRNHQRGT